MPTENASDRSFPGWISRISHLKFALQGRSVLQASKSFQKKSSLILFFSVFLIYTNYFPKRCQAELSVPQKHTFFLISSTNTNQKLVGLFKIGAGGRSRVFMAVILRGPIAFSIQIF